MSVLVSSLAPFFRHAGRGVVDCRRRRVLRVFSCGRRLVLLCLPRASRSVFPPVPLSCLLAIRSAFVVVSPGLPAHSASGAGRFVARAWFFSVAVCCLSWPLMRRVGSSRGGCSLPPCRWRRRDCCRSAACRAVVSRAGVALLVAVSSFLLACPRRRAARGVLAIVCGLVLCRPSLLASPSSSGVVVACCRGLWLVVVSVVALVVGRRCPSFPCLSSVVVVGRVGSVVVSSSVASSRGSCRPSSRRIFAPPCLSIRRGGVRGVFSLVPCGLLLEASFRVSLVPSWRVVAVLLALPSCVGGSSSACCLLGGGAGASRVCVSLVSDTHFAPSPSCRGGGAISFFACLFFPFFC